MRHIATCILREKDNRDGQREGKETEAERWGGGEKEREEKRPRCETKRKVRVDRKRDEGRERKEKK